MTLSPHFTIEELTHSELAARFGIYNGPPHELLQNLERLADMLEEVRAGLGAPVIILSGYRCEELNRLLGSKQSSAHLQGLAADFICPAFGPPLKVARWLAASSIEFDQLIYEFNAWVHIGLRTVPRRQVLTIDRQGARYGLD